MSYVFRQQYSLNSDFPAHSSEREAVVLLVEPDPEALAVYARHLGKAGVMVGVCLELNQVMQHVVQLRPHVLIMNPTSNLNLSLETLQQVRVIHPSLSVITVGSAIPDQYLDRLMGAGVALHINRHLSQPRDLVIAVRQMLN